MLFGKIIIASYEIQKLQDKLTIQSRLNNKLNTKYSSSELNAISYLLTFIRCIRTFREDTSGLLFDTHRSSHEEFKDIVLTTNINLFNIAQNSPSKSNRFNIEIYYRKKEIFNSKGVVPIRLNLKNTIYNKDNPDTNYITDSSKQFDNFIGAAGFIGEVEVIKTLELYKSKILESSNEEVYLKIKAIEGFCLEIFRHYDSLERQPFSIRKERNNKYIRESLRQYEILISPLWDSYQPGMRLKELENKASELLKKYMFGL